jgi:hypothetical protein
MQKYTFDFDKESQDLWTLIMSFGKYKYAWLPMGLKCSPNIAQAIMESTLAGVIDTDVYIDAMGTFSKMESPCASSSRHLGWLRENGFQAMYTPQTSC